MKRRRRGRESQGSRGWVSQINLLASIGASIINKRKKQSVHSVGARVLRSTRTRKSFYIFSIAFRTRVHPVKVRVCCCDTDNLLMFH